MFKTFQERQADRKQVMPRFVRIDELLSEPSRPTSEERLERLPSDQWSVEQFEAAADSLVTTGSFEVVVAPPQLHLPDLTTDTQFRYAQEYVDAAAEIPRSRTLRVATVLEAGRLIAYGIARRRQSGNSIDIVDVDRASTRSAGVFTIVHCGTVALTVGLGHVIVDALLRTLPRPVAVDATHASSRYIFKSLGFIKRVDQANPCLLELGDSR